MDATNSPQPGYAPPAPTGARPAVPQQARPVGPPPGWVPPPPRPVGGVAAAAAPQQPYAPAARPAPTVAAAPSAPAAATAPPAPSGGARLGSDDAPVPVALAELLEQVVARGASDLHLTASSPPMVRVSGGLMPVQGAPTLSSTDLQSLLFAILTNKQRERFEASLELDFAYTLPGSARFRVNMYRQRNAVGAVFRLIPYEIKKLEDLGVPPSINHFAMLPRGFVLVTGPTGSGKSTTLASLIDLANRQRRDHIMTVEDPIEFLHSHQGCLVNQREVGEDTHSFGAALKHVLRQDPDIILVGELRDLETISVALTAAETGHLVFATLHTQDAAQTIDRIIDVFPAGQQQQVRTQLAGALQGVVCQQLLRTADGRGRAVATEVMVATPAIRALIRDGKTHQIYSSLQAGAKHNMHTMDQHLAELVRAGKVAFDAAMEKCHHLEDFTRLCGRG